MARKKDDLAGYRLPKWQREYRKTGRTLRMLTAALSLHRQGHDVVVYAISQEHARCLIYTAKRIAEGIYSHDVVEEQGMVLRIVKASQGAKSKPESPGVRFYVPNKDAVDWRTMKVADGGRRAITLFDHATIEHSLTAAITELHRWDESQVDEWTRTIEVPA